LGLCATCGSLVTYRRDTRPDHHDITTATLDDPDAFPPTAEIWVGEKIGWEALNPGIAAQAAEYVERAISPLPHAMKRGERAIRSS